MEFFVTTVIAAISMVAGIAAYRMGRRQALKRLHYTVNRYEFLLWQDETVAARVNGHTLIYPSIYVFRLEHTGNAPIVINDFSGPVRIHFGKPAQIMVGLVQWNRPRILETSTHLEATGGDLLIKPVLLNPRDRIEVIIVVDGVPSKPFVEARIAGVEEVAYLPPRREGIQMKLDGTSLIYKTTEEWPQVPGRLDPTFFVIPAVVDPIGSLHQHVELMVDGVSVPNAHRYLVVFEAKDGRPVRRNHLDGPLSLDWPTSELKCVRAKLGDRSLSKDQMSRFLRWNQHNLEITPAPLKAGEKLSVDAIVSGPGEDVLVKNMPSIMRDVQIGRVNLKDFVDDNLASVEPLVLLSNEKAHALWWTWAPVVQRKADRMWRELQSSLKKLSHSDRR
ncbi:hypothetical protein ACQRWP_06725 [Micromonospora trifolii]|uniref:hypothetical protein n=1 Tax=Micromonospora trifolii TaxID=2911208 RepID=UPI003D2EDF6C